MNKLCEQINGLVPEGRAMVASENLVNSQGYRFIRAMSWGTSLLAVLVGVLGVMNTMLMTVFERTHEICVLLAIGWKRGRIVRMVLCESALLGLLGGVVGVLIGVVGVKVLQTTPAIRGLLEPDLNISLFLISVAIAVVVGIVQRPLSRVAQFAADAERCTARVSFFPMKHRRSFLPVPLLCALFAFSVRAADTASPNLSAQDLAARLSAIRQDGNSYVRVRLEVKDSSGSAKTTLQLQIKSRRTESATDVVYQVLWPKERKGEAVLWRKKAGGEASGSLFLPPDKIRSLDASQLKQPLFGSDLSYEDIFENFFAWERQAIVGTEVINGANCQILESKPGKGTHSSYASVRTWIDPHRMVPLRVEKFAAPGALVRRIDTTRVITDDVGHQIPANLTVRRPGQDSITELEGSRIEHGVTYPDLEFTQAGLKEVTIPRSAP